MFTLVWLPSNAIESPAAVKLDELSYPVTALSPVVVVTLNKPDKLSLETITRTSDV